MKRRGLVGVALGLAAVGSLPCLALLPPPHHVAPRELRADAALVLSGDVDYLRLRRAAELYASGSVGQVLLTGAGYGGDSAVTLRETLVGFGVPQEAVLLEPSSTTTRENLLYARSVVRAKGWKRMALVTSDSHMGRAERVARKLMPEVEWASVAVPDAGPPSRVYRQRLSEWVKLLGYKLRGWA